MCSCAALAALKSPGTWPLAQAAAEAASRLKSTRQETPEHPVHPSPLAVLPQIPEAISVLIETLPAIAVLFAVAFGIVLFLPLLTLEPRKLDEADERREGCRANDAPAWEGSESELSLADTPKACTPSKDRKREEYRKVEAPRHRACGRLTLKATVGHGGAVRAMCSIEGHMLTLSIAGGEGSQSTSAVAMKVPVEELAVGMQRGRADMFKIATLHKQMLYDEVCCFTDDQAEHDEWIAVFRRMGVAFFHFHEASADMAHLRICRTHSASAAPTAAPLPRLRRSHSGPAGLTADTPPQPNALAYDKVNVSTDAVHFPQVKAISEAMGERAGVARACSGLGNYLQSTRQYARALELHTEHKATSEALGDRAALLSQLFRHTHRGSVDPKFPSHPRRNHSIPTDPATTQLPGHRTHSEPTASTAAPPLARRSRRSETSTTQFRRTHSDPTVHTQAPPLVGRSRRKPAPLVRKTPSFGAFDTDAGIEAYRDATTQLRRTHSDPTAPTQTPPLARRSHRKPSYSARFNFIAFGNALDVDNTTRTGMVQSVSSGSRFYANVVDNRLGLVLTSRSPGQSPT
jgi:hypothetical protein